MFETIHNTLQKNPKRILLAVCFLTVLSIIGTTLLILNNKRTQAQTAGATYQIETSAEIPVPDVPVNVSFENIPDDSFLPPQAGKLIRINLVTMKLVRYENGELIGQPIDILVKGKMGSFWETPGGSYPIIDKGEDYYSEKAGVFFPYTMHLFGNYVIHGEPHDKNNKTLTRNTDGGIRLSDENAQTIYIWSDSDTRVSVYSDSKLKPQPLSPESVYITASGVVMPKVSAESYIVADLDSGEIILESNKDSVYPIASVSKLMTALVSIDTMNQFEFATVSKKATQVYSVNKFAPGEKIALSNLIYPLLLPSSNVAAEIIAEHPGREKFMSEMNEQALTLGMTNTHYDDPSGLSPQNTSTAYDLFLLTQNLFKEKSFVFNITLVPSYNAQGHYWKNISQFLKVPGYLGGKSGQTGEAKQSNVALFKLPLSESTSRNIAIIVLRSNDRYTDTMKIFNFVKSRVVYGSDKNVIINDNNDLSSNIILSFVGDIMLDRGVKFSIRKNFGGDYSKLFQNMDMLRKSDLTFANLEGPVSDKGIDLKNLYSFRMDPPVLDILKNAGFDVLLFANNHVGDWGREAFDDTLARMQTAGLKYTGAGTTKQQAEQPVIETIKGVRFGFLGFTDVGPDKFAATETTSGVLLASDPRFTEIIQNAKSQVDTLIVTFHWGVEYQEHTARQSNFAHIAIDAGANLIIGTHPHVAQDIETYRGGLIAYSLGNFIFDQGFSKETMQGLLLQVTFDARTKTFKRYDKYIVKFSPQFQPQVPELVQ